MSDGLGRWTVLFVTVLSGSAEIPEAVGAPPAVQGTWIESAFDPVRPGDPVTVTVRATRKGGLRELRGFLTRSKYLRADGKGEVMAHLIFKPTGRQDEFRADFIVSATDGGDKKTALPEGPYRFELTGGVDGGGL